MIVSLDDLFDDSLNKPSITGELFLLDVSFDNPSIGGDTFAESGLLLIKKSEFIEVMVLPDLLDDTLEEEFGIDKSCKSDIFEEAEFLVVKSGNESIVVFDI